jgi:hypothetical protein
MDEATMVPSTLAILFDQGCQQPERNVQFPITSAWSKLSDGALMQGIDLDMQAAILAAELLALAKTTQSPQTKK